MSNGVLIAKQFYTEDKGINKHVFLSELCIA